MKTMAVTLRVASEEDKTLFKNLFNMYQNELGLYCAEFQDVDPNGYYDAASADWLFSSGGAVIPIVIECDERIAGFAVITLPPYCPENYDYCIQEFFVVGYYRGKGVAQAAAEALLGAVKGRYAAAVLNKNQRAKIFFSELFLRYGGTERPFGEEFTLFSMDNRAAETE